MSQANTNSLPMPRVRPRILAMLTTGADERRNTKSRQRPSASGRSAALATSRWATKKSGFADWNTTTFTDGSASRSVISARNSTIVEGIKMLIGGLLKVTVHWPGWVRSVLNCGGSLRSCVAPAWLMMSLLFWIELRWTFVQAWLVAFPVVDRSGTFREGGASTRRPARHSN